MTVYVGLVTYNSLSDLAACFEGLRAQTCQNVQVLVWDNASRDDSAGWVRANAPQARLIENSENVGFGRAHNGLIRAATLQAGDYYLALNPDARLAPDYLHLLVETLARDAQIGWAVGKIRLESEQQADAGLIYSAGHGMLRSGYAFNIGYGLADDERFAYDREVFGAPGAAALYKAELIADLSIGGEFFDSCMFMYAEDTDVDWRARRHGWRCWYVAQAVALHRGSRPTGRLKMTAIANRYLSVLKNAAPFDLLAYNLPLLLAHCLARLIVTPRLGLALLQVILKYAPTELTRRRSDGARSASVREWFRWSARQPTMQQSGLATLRSRFQLRR